jgi:hypothetical protein
MAQRNGASAETLASTMIAGTLTLGGFVIVALFGALLALLSLERLVRAGALGERRQRATGDHDQTHTP